MTVETRHRKAEADRIVRQALEFALYFAKNELSYDFFGFGTHKGGIFKDLLDSNSHFANAFQDRDKELARVVNDKSKILCYYCVTTI